MAETESVKDTTTPDSGNTDANGEQKNEHIEVHSANAWEDADLGDEDRKNKFLRLMGAGKKEHHGRFVIGDHNPEHPRNKDQTDQLQHQLEDQYTHSMQHRLAGGRRGHIGLGYHDSDLDPKPPEDGGSERPSDDNKGGNDDDDGGDDGGDNDESEEKRKKKKEEEEKEGRKEEEEGGKREKEEGRTDDSSSRKRESREEGGEGGKKDDDDKDGGSGSPPEKKKMKFVPASS